MKRIDRTRRALAEYGHTARRGADAALIAMLVGASRQNVSTDLNELWRQGLAVKVPGRPVLYWDPAAFAAYGEGTAEAADVAAAPHTAAPPAARATAPFVTGTTAVRPASATGHHAGGVLEPGQVSRAIAGSAAAPKAPAPAPANADPFARLIGSDGSLRTQVEQAKAAVLYPPHGLHALLSGATGVGKSLFAETMHQFALMSGRLPHDAPFVTLNCADYAHSPQLLVAQLFGVVKGAYTGAEQDRAGLVEQADGGILFLDEVHRLPAEGQEMLFRLIDKGKFRRLGESGAERHAQVMLVLATTERPDSALLRSFMRRIPMVIHLPALAGRTAAERFRFVRRFLRAEAAKIGLDIWVPRETLRLLLQYECLGNIGQLRNDLQLGCAHAFLQYLTHRREPIELVPEHLPAHIHRLVPGLRQQDQDVTELLRRYGNGFHARKDDGDWAEADEGLASLSFYSVLEQQMQELTRLGVDPAEAERQVEANIAQHFHEFLDRVQAQQRLQRLELTKAVEQPVLQAVEKAVLWAESRLGRAVPEQVLYALALHVQAAREQVQQGRRPRGAGPGLGPDGVLELADPAAPTPGRTEARVAAEVVAMLGQELNMPLPPSDVAFVSLLLQPETAAPADFGVVVVAHGRGVASGMLDVAQELTGVACGHALDMALDASVDTVADELVALAGRYPGGLLLLVDMGSLERLGEIVQERTGVPVCTITAVSSPLVLEAVHQASMPGASLHQVHQAVLNTFARVYGTGQRAWLPPVIVAFCFTGSGSAQALAQMVQESVRDTGRDVEVIEASIGAGSAWTRLIGTLQQTHRLLAVVGPVNPQIVGVPFISSEDMVTGRGAKALQRLVQGGLADSVMDNAPPPHADAGPVTGTLYDLAAAALGRHLVFTNPQASVPAIARLLNRIEAGLGQPLADDVRVGVTMHLACLIEARVRQQLGAPADAAEAADDALAPLASANDTPPCGAPAAWLAAAVQDFARMFRVRLGPDDLGRLAEVLLQSPGRQG